MNQDPMKEWVLRDELLAAFHRWPMIILFALVGTLLGLMFAYLWPAAYRASVELSVELNPYRILDDQYIPEFSGVEFRNIDDYKHWQMLQLSIVVLSDPYLQETLTRLGEKNKDWSSVSVQDLREMLSANWRNAGLWNFSAVGSTSAEAVEAIETWREVVIELTQKSIAFSRDLFRLELALRSLNNELVDIHLQQAALEALQVDLANILAKLSSMPVNEVLSIPDRQEMFAIANQITVHLPGEQIILNSFPQEGAPVSEYIVWLEGVNLVFETELNSIELRIKVISDEISQISAQWEENLINASGLSATLNIENRQSENTQVEELRSYSLAALIGALVGLLAWIMVLLVRITRKGYQ